jgi:hypothetical protein
VNFEAVNALGLLTSEKLVIVLWRKRLVIEMYVYIAVRKFFLQVLKSMDNELD